MPGTLIVAYLEYALKSPGVQRHRFLRELFALSRQVTGPIFLQTLARALRYRVIHKETLQRIAWFCTTQHDQHLADLVADVDQQFHQRPAYQEGCLTEQPDLSVYDLITPDDSDHDSDSHFTESEPCDG